MNGQREIRLEVEVPGTPEQVWDAIATGPGITSWFVPAELAGDKLNLEMMPGDVYEHRVTASEPPRRFVYQAEAGGDVMAFEWLVEATSGGSCIVRLVNSGFEPGSSWENDYDGMEAGWRLFMDNLRLYLTHFAGEPCTPVLVSGTAEQPRVPAWRDMAARLGLADAAEGRCAQTTGPVVSGTVERLTDSMLTLLLDEPAHGYMFFASEGSGEQAYLSIYLYLFGDGAPHTAAEQGAAWRAWMEERAGSPVS
jgi:uncharacterized protein YndB with AHSA1/START domain